VQEAVKRWKWCKKHLDWSAERWKMIIFSDESNFEMVNRKTKVMDGLPVAKNSDYQP
jgi:hypothetical protein